MSPEYIEHLADLADPGQLWRKSPLDEMSIEQAQRRDTGIALRRHASHVRRLNELRDTGNSLCITPLGLHGTATEVIPTPTRRGRAPRGWL